MRLPFDFHPEAQAEFEASADWYDERSGGAGVRFEDAVREAIDAAVDSPEAWAVWPGWDRDPVVRSKGVSGFPFRVVYFADGDMVKIVAVAHEKRRPGYWRDRVAR